MLCVRCLAMGFHPSKARHKGQFLLAQPSAPRAHSMTCSKGHRLQNENEAPCPICGDTRRIVHAELRAQSTSSARLGSVTIQRLQTEMEKNWPLIAALIACNLLSAIP